MNSIGSWLRQFSARLGAGLRSFMAGRYGTDRLNMVILCVSGSEPSVRLFPVHTAEFVLGTAELRSDDLGDLAQFVPEHLQAVPGESEIPANCRAAEGQAQPVF